MCKSMAVSHSFAATGPNRGNVTQITTEVAMVPSCLRAPVFACTVLPAPIAAACMVGLVVVNLDSAAEGHQAGKGEPTSHCQPTGIRSRVMAHSANAVSVTTPSAPSREPIRADHDWKFASSCAAIKAARAASRSSI
jgi:hypothetical protein